MKIFSFVKKLPFLVILFILINSAAVQAQSGSDSEMNLSVGARTGFAFSTLSIDRQPFTNQMAAPIAGGYVQMSFMPWLAVSLDVLYTQYGGNEINPLWIYSPQSQALQNLQNSLLLIHTVELPLAVKLGLPNWSESVSPFISLGGSIAFFTQARITNYYLDESYPFQPFYYESTEFVTSAINTFDYALIPGMGIDFNTTSWHFTLEFYYRIGISAVNGYKTTYSPDFGANAFGIKIGVGLGL